MTATHNIMIDSTSYYYSTIGKCNDRPLTENFAHNFHQISFKSDTLLEVDVMPIVQHVAYCATCSLYVNSCFSFSLTYTACCPIVVILDMYMYSILCYFQDSVYCFCRRHKHNSRSNTDGRTTATECAPALYHNNYCNINLYTHCV